MMSDAFPELLEREAYVKRVVRAEEERFMATLDNGLRILNEEVEALKLAGQREIPGDLLFKLYDTFGFPGDLTADIVASEGFGIDETGFHTCMEEQRKKAREHWKGSGEPAVSTIYPRLREEGISSEFTGYHALTDYGTILALVRAGERIDSAKAGEAVEVITSATPFYGESGGQAGDEGTISSGAAHLRVLETRRPLPELTVHLCEVLSGVIRSGEAVDLTVTAAVRRASALNHTATHILQAVLGKVLGEHIKQAGSLVTPERLRFDFTHFSAVTAEELTEIESQVNSCIRDNGRVETRIMSADSAVAAGATALFGEKYGETVRVVSVGDFSMELCVGTHTAAAGDIGLFKIVQESGIAAGVRRIEAVTGAGALQLVQEEEETLRRLAAIVKSDRGQLEARLKKLVEQQRELEREVETLSARLHAGRSQELLAQVREIAGVKFLAAQLDGLDGKGLREFSDQLRDRFPAGVVVLGSAADGKANLLVAVSKDLLGRLSAGELIKPLAAQVGGKGGGRPELAQAGGTDPAGLAAALAAVGGLLGKSLG
jgi:alanyl-tRNA synthetase